MSKRKKKTIDRTCNACKADECHGDFDGVQIFYDLPARELMSRRKTGHWAKTSELLAGHRLIGEKQAERAVCCHRPLWTDVIMDATFYFTDSRSFQDSDNLWFWLKAYRDGIEDAGIVINDRAIQTGDLDQKIGAEIMKPINSAFGVVVVIKNNTRPEIPIPTPGRHDKFHRTIEKLEAKNKVKREKKKVKS